jgi:Holliday junction resolvasome RuvABC endonuclease subunit
MSNTSTSRLGLTQPTFENINLLHVCAGAPKEKLRYSVSAASDRVDGAVGDATQTGGALTLLAIDLGTTTGWALRPRDQQIAHGFVTLKPQRFEGGGMRYLRFKRWLTELKGLATDIHAVYFEEVRRHVGVDAAHVYGGLMATLTTWCEHHGIPYQGVPVGTIKKHATGKGNAGKEEVLAAMRAKGHPVADDNEADALALLHWAIDTQEAA